MSQSFLEALTKSTHGWQYMVGLGGILSTLLGILLFWCSESPRQFLYHYQQEQCARILRRIYPHATEQQISDKILSIDHGVKAAQIFNEEISSRTALKHLFCVPANLRATIAACGLMAFQQFSGFNTLMYYSPTLFAIVGFSNPIAVGTAVAATNWIFTVLSIIFIDRIG